MSRRASRAGSWLAEDTYTSRRRPTDECQHIARVGGAHGQVRPRDEQHRSAKAPALRDAIEQSLAARLMAEHTQEQEPCRRPGRGLAQQPQRRERTAAIGSERGHANADARQAEGSDEARGNGLGHDDQPPAIDDELHVAEPLVLERAGQCPQAPPRQPADGQGDDQVEAVVRRLCGRGHRELEEDVPDRRGVERQDDGPPEEQQADAEQERGRQGERHHAPDAVPATPATT
jgi:hypothetical protein